MAITLKFSFENLSFFTLLYVVLSLPNAGKCREKHTSVDDLIWLL